VTTQINIAVGGEGLRQRLGAETAANRFRQLNAARDNALALEAQINAVTAQEPPRYTTPTTAPGPLPAATRISYPVASAWVYQWRGIDTTNSTPTAPNQPAVWNPNLPPATVYNAAGNSLQVTFPTMTSPHCDLSQYVREDSTGRRVFYQGNDRFYADFFTPRLLNLFSLPVSKNTQLVVLSTLVRATWTFQDYDDTTGAYINQTSTTTTQLASDSIKILLVSPETIRQINVPSTFRNVIKDVEQSLLDQDYPGFLVMTDGYPRGVGYHPDGSELYSGPLNTPSTFSFLNDYTTVPLGTYVPHFDDIAVYEFIRDTFAPTYTGPWLVQDKVSTNQLTFPIQKRSLETPYSYVSTRPNPRSNTTVPASVISAYSQYQTQYQGGPDTTFVGSWDWGNSAYCLQQLLAWGFTTSDLTP